MDACTNIPGASGYFSHELEGSPGFIFTRVAFEVPPVPLPSGGRMAIIIDPTGGVLGLWAKA